MIAGTLQNVAPNRILVRESTAPGALAELLKEGASGDLHAFCLQAKEQRRKDAKILADKTRRKRAGVLSVA